MRKKLNIQWLLVIGFTLLGLSATMAFAEDLPPEAQWKEEGVCARVRISVRMLPSPARHSGQRLRLIIRRTTCSLRI